MNWINVLLILVFTSVATFFALSNTTEVQLAFGGLVSDPAPLYLPVFSAFLVGFLGGVLSLSFSRHKHKREIAALREENMRLKQEVENLRNIPLLDDL